VAVDAQHVVIGFDAEFPQEAQQAAKGRDSRVVLENVLGTFLGRKVAVKFVTVARELGAPPAPAAPTGQPSAKLPAAADAAPAPAPMGEGRKGKSVQEWTKDPTVSKTLEMFNGSIVDVRE
ncbi:MAG: hypothetical protein O3B24_06335, partial [Verrucomicrobia bacterium]|nr:hypothetical protein [Verrucomicrobiota bacterium]